MAKLSLITGQISVSINLFIQDSSKTDGSGLTGLVFNSAGLTAYYCLPRAAPVAISLITLAANTSAYSSGGFKEIDATNMPGWYRLDIPNAAIASGRFVSAHLKGATNMAPLPLEIDLGLGSVWDEINTGATHNVNNSSGKQLRTISPGSSDIIRTGTAQSGGANTITLDAGASSVDNVYNFDIMSITAGTGAGQSKYITAYNGTTKVATVNSAWSVNPDATSVFEITPTSVSQVISYAAGQDPATLLAATLVSVTPTTGTWGEAMAFALAGIGKSKITYLPPSGINTNDGVMTVYAKDGTTVLKTFSGINQDASGNTTVRV